MSRVQLALNVSDMEAAIAFYSKLLRMPPTKRREGYANFAVADPPLKLVLIEDETADGRLNHLGIEVDSGAEVEEAALRFDAAGLASEPEDGVVCCYALQDKVWVTDPQGARWEVYTVIDDADSMGSGPPKADPCCAPAVAGAGTGT